MHLPSLPAWSATLRSPRFVVWASVSVLIVALISLATFNIVQAHHAVMDIREINRSQDVSDAFDSASQDLAQANAAKAALLARPDPGLLQLWDTDVAEWAKEIGTVSVDGTASEQQIATSLEANLGPILAAERSLLAEVIAEGRQDGPEYFQQQMAATVPGVAQMPSPDTSAYESPDGLDNPLTLAWMGLLNKAAHEETIKTSVSMDEFLKEQTRNLGVVVFLNAAGLVFAVFLLAGANRFGRRNAVAEAELVVLRRAVLTDSLTGLGNRRAFEEASDLACGQAARTGAGLALAIIDVDEFKSVNDTWGHDGGDRLLKSIAAILKNASGAATGLFRIGGDEFAMILPGADREAALASAERVRRTAESSLRGTTLSIGIAAWHSGVHDAELLGEEADAALYDAKMYGRNLSIVYEKAPEATPLFPAAKLQAVRRLLAEGDITAVFHPIWHLDSHSILAYEALSRPNESYGLSGPQQAFEIAERFGRVADLDRICVERILASVSGLPESALLFINLSPYYLTHHSFSAAALRNRIETAGLSARRVVFEITERSQVAPELVAEAVAALHGEGFRIALDDVGTGNTGFEMLRKVPCEFMKIDHSVMASAIAGSTGRAAVMAILAFAAGTGAFVVVEGIEDSHALEFVQSIAEAPIANVGGLIQGVQGFLWGKPAREFAMGLPHADGEVSADDVAA